MLKDWLKVTDDPAEIQEIAKRLIKEITIYTKSGYKPFYTPLMLSKMDEEIAKHLPGISSEEKDTLRYIFIYDFWVFGCTVDEEFYLHLVDKSSSEKEEYIVRMIRSIYVSHLNWDAGPDRVEKLEDKYRLFQILKPYYKRDVIEIRTMDDLNEFESFAKRHPIFVVKPADSSLGIGVHKVSMDDYDNDYQTALRQIIGEGEAIHARHPSRATKMVLEELIIQDETMASLHRGSVNAIRATAVKGKDGSTHIYHPWIKVGIRGSFVATAAQDGFVSEIDPATGCLMTDGFQETGDVYTHHPDTGIKIKGFQIPRWNELKEFVNHIMAELPEYGYIGWDLVLTPEGWCVMEGNYSGEFMFQLINGRGYKRDFEELIGWKYDKDFWWEDAERFSHN